MLCAQTNTAMSKKEIIMNKRYTKKQITEAIAYWKKQLKAGNYKKLDEDAKSEYDENGRDEYGFTSEETDVFLFDIVDQTGSTRNGNYDHYAVRTDGTIPEHEVKRRLDEMVRAWSGNALRNAKREAKKRHEQLKPYDMPYLAFKVANVKHMTKQQFIEDDSLGEIRFFSIDD